MVALRLVAILTTIVWSEDCECLMHAKSVVLDKRKLLMKSILHSHLDLLIQQIRACMQNIAKSSRRTPIWLLFIVTCSKQS